MSDILHLGYQKVGENQMQTEPIITTNNMSVDDVSAWITEKAQSIQKLQSLRAERDREIRDHERTISRLDEDIIKWEDRCALTVQPQ
ncbi:hypothetical protein DQ401_17960 [Morganella morganii]|nr:hypothetical protein DQ401_17960 [Morganella morganii]